LDELTDFWSYVASTYGLNSTELAFVQGHRLEFVDNLTFNLSYLGVGGLNLTVVDPENSTNVVNLNFVGGVTAITSQIIYADGFSGDPAGYEGVRSFAIATTKVTNDILNYWLNQYSLYQPGGMKAAYGTFLNALMMEYTHDQLADNLTSQYNVTWSRTSPIIVSVGDEYYQTYMTLECDHNMGMTVIGTPANMWMFNYICSFAISPIEYAIMDNIGYQQIYSTNPRVYVNSVTLDLIGEYLDDNSSVEAFMQNGYIIEKAVGKDDNFIVIDPETGIVRDINTIMGYCGAYCFHDALTKESYELGESEVQGTKHFNWNKFWKIVHGGITMGLSGAGMIAAFWFAPETVGTSLLFVGTTAWGVYDGESTILDAEKEPTWE
jgi:hypothetical protein